MLFEYVLMYVLVDVFCLVFAFVIYSKITVDMGTEREVRALRWFIVAYVVFLVADAVWALGEYGALPMTDAATGIMEAATLVVMGAIAYCWFLYAEFRLDAPYADRRFFALFAAAPMAVVLALYATTRFTGWIYTIGPDASFTEGPAAALPMFIFLAYVVYVSIHALVRSLRETSSVRRGEVFTLVLFAVPPTVCGILDLLVHGMPVMALSVFASLLLVFMNTQDSRINTDALTGLNNRRRAVEYIEDSLAGMSEGTLFGVFMIDVDFFKDINDTRGHGEGDHALQLIAEGLRRAIDGHHGLAARWGGDEFLVATYLDPIERPVDLEDDIQHAISSACERVALGYAISVSVGYALADRGDALSDLVVEADRMLYERKAAHHAAAGRSR